MTLGQMQDLKHGEECLGHFVTARQVRDGLISEYRQDRWAVLRIVLFSISRVQVI